MLSKVMAGCLALAAFAVAVLAGLAAGNAAEMVLVRALMAMFLCYPVGFIIGMVCERIIASHVEERSEEMRAEAEDEISSQSGGEQVEDEEVLTV